MWEIKKNISLKDIREQAVTCNLILIRSDLLKKRYQKLRSLIFAINNHYEGKGGKYCLYYQNRPC